MCMSQNKSVTLSVCAPLRFLWQKIDENNIQITIYVLFFKNLAFASLPKLKYFLLLNFTCAPSKCASKIFLTSPPNLYFVSKLY